MNESKSAKDALSKVESTTWSHWLPTAIKWGVGIYWYGMLAVTGVALIFFIAVSTMTHNRFPFPFEAPVMIQFPAMDSLNANFGTDSFTITSSNGSADTVTTVKADLNEGLEEIEKMSFKAFALDGDLMFTVPMRQLWPFLLVGFFTPIIIALAIAFHLRKIFKSLTLALPFDPANIRRVKIIGWLVVVQGPLESLVKYWSANSLLPQVADMGWKMESALNFQYQSILFGILILALVHIFEVGARLQQDQELTI